MWFSTRVFYVADLGTLDAILCGQSSFLNVAIAMKEIQRVLKSGGIYILISYGKPKNRLFHFVGLPYISTELILGST